MTLRELETVLCALRAWQLAIEQGRAVSHMDLDFPPLDSAEIDALCERLNTITPGKVQPGGCYVLGFACPDCGAAHSEINGPDAEGFWDCRACGAGWKRNQ